MSSQLRILVIGAHPDDCDIKAGGIAIKYASLDHNVRFVSVTNGDAGHHEIGGVQLANRRRAEAEAAGAVAGIEYHIMDNHDGELESTLENRKKIIRMIRSYTPDLILTHRPNDYHPDHRYTGILVQDAAFMVTVPFFVPDTKPLKKNPVFMYYPDRFTKPYPFEPTITIAIDDIFEKKVHGIDALVSQVYEGGAGGSEETLIQRNAGDPVARKAILKTSWERRNGGIATRYRDSLIEWYGQDRGKAVKVAESFQLCEYGHRPSKAELKKLFPFFD